MSDQPATTQDGAGATPRVVCLGVHILDTLGHPVDEVPPGQGSTRLQQIRMTPAGTAAGTAVDLAVLGADVATVGAVGTDEIGAFLLGRMRDQGVDVTAVSRIDGAQTSASILPIRSNGERPALHVSGVNGIVRLEQLDLTPLATARAVHVGGIEAMRSITREEVADVLRRLRGRGALVTMDLQSSPQHTPGHVVDWLPWVDVFLPNLEQAAGLTGAADPSAIAERLLDHGARAVVLTMGEEGSLYATREQQISTPAFDVDVVDTTGCGDAFCAAFIVAALRGEPPARALRLATGAATLVASGLGSDAGLQGWAHLEAFVGQQP